MQSMKSFGVLLYVPDNGIQDCRVVYESKFRYMDDAAGVPIYIRRERNLEEPAAVERTIVYEWRTDGVTRTVMCLRDQSGRFTFRCDESAPPQVLAATPRGVQYGPMVMMAWQAFELDENGLYDDQVLVDVRDALAHFDRGTLPVDADASTLWKAFVGVVGRKGPIYCPP